jgi:hypothetical protein
VFGSVRTGALPFKRIPNLIQKLLRTATPADKPPRMYWINSQSTLVNVCGAAFALMSVRLMHCSGQIHQCQLDKAEANLFMELKLWLLRYLALGEVMDPRRHR